MAIPVLQMGCIAGQMGANPPDVVPPPAPQMGCVGADILDIIQSQMGVGNGKDNQ